MAFDCTNSVPFSVRRSGKRPKMSVGFSFSRNSGSGRAALGGLGLVDWLLQVLLQQRCSHGSDVTTLSM